MHRALKRGRAEGARFKVPKLKFKIQDSRFEEKTLAVLYNKEIPPLFVYNIRQPLKQNTLIG